MSIQSHIIDLLQWARDHGLEPRRPRSSDLYLEVTTKRMIAYRDLMPHQRRHAFWIPTPKGLKELGLRTKERNVGGLTILTGGNLVGAGPGPREASLSIVNQMRANLLAA